MTKQTNKKEIKAGNKVKTWQGQYGRVTKIDGKWATVDFGSRKDDYQLWQLEAC